VTESDHQLAARLATEAGELLLGVRAELADADARERKAAGDKRSHDFLMAALAAERPGDAVLSEEGADDRIRLTSDRVWIVDPLDGTREFSELGREDWAVHVALWVRDGDHGELVAGAVALPAQGVTPATPDVAPPPPAPATPRIVVSRTRPPEVALAVRDALGGTLVEMGSAGAKVAAVVQGLADVYVHAGGQYEWDSAAPVAVARAAGLFTSRIDGSPLRYNQSDVLLPDLIVCRPELADAVLAVTTR
jgi:3'(2'), 5'-bisphosphate nucleotidase